MIDVISRHAVAPAGQGQGGDLYLMGSEKLSWRQGRQGREGTAAQEPA